MHEDERKLFNELIEMRNDTNERINTLMARVFALIALVVFFLSVTLGVVVVSFSNAIEEIVTVQNKVMEECTRIYFETPYEMPEFSQTQDVKVGDN
jgi:hypothetical protein